MARMEPVQLLAACFQLRSAAVPHVGTGPKLRTYAAAGVPVSVLIDRHSAP